MVPRRGGSISRPAGNCARDGKCCVGSVGRLNSNTTRHLSALPPRDFDIVRNATLGMVLVFGGLAEGHHAKMNIGSLRRDLIYVERCAVFRPDFDVVAILT